MLRRSLLPLLLLAACSRAPPPAPEPPAQASPTLPEAPPAPRPPPPPPGPEPATTVVREATALQPGDTATALDVERSTAVDPSATFRVVVAGSSRDARLALHDGADAAVPSSSTVEIGDTTVLTLSPTVPLVPGSRYQLRLDGAVTRELHLGDRSLTPAVWALQAAGDPPPPPPARKRARK